MSEDRPLTDAETLLRLTDECVRSIKGEGPYQLAPGVIVFVLTKKHKIKGKLRLFGNKGPLGRLLDDSEHPKVVAAFDAREVLRFIAKHLERMVS